jgi:ABC-2 type transport system permease protein
MHGIWVIFKREVRQYFTSPIAYLVAFAVLFLNGMFFSLDLRGRNGLYPLDSTYILGFFAFIMIFLAPLLTMRLLAEESREGTFELLLTMPIRDGDIVIGKYLGAWLYYTLLLLSTLVYQVILFAVGFPDVGAIIAAYIGIWLYGGAVIAVGLLFSALTENQIIAGFLSMVVLFMLWLADSFGALFTSIGVDAARFVRALSLRSHHATSFLLGIFRLEDVVFYVGLIAVMLYVTTQIVAARRWRG